MYWTSILAIYFILWFFCLFFVLPFHARPTDDDTPLVPGQVESAPAHFPVWRVVAQVSIASALLCALYVANYYQGWLTLADIKFFKPPS